MPKALAIIGVLALAACSQTQIEDFAASLPGGLMSGFCEGDRHCHRTCPDGSITDSSRPVCPRPIWLEP